MARRKKVKPAAPRVRRAVMLAAEYSLADAARLRERLAALVDEPDPVTLDVSALQRLDTASLQLLLAFASERRTAAHRVTWRGRSPALNTAAQLLGLTSALGLPA